MKRWVTAAVLAAVLVLPLLAGPGTAGVPYKVRQVADITISHVGFTSVAQSGSVAGQGVAFGTPLWVGAGDADDVLNWDGLVSDNFELLDGVVNRPENGSAGQGAAGKYSYADYTILFEIRGGSPEKIDVRVDLTPLSGMPALAYVRFARYSSLNAVKSGECPVETAAVGARHLIGSPNVPTILARVNEVVEDRHDGESQNDVAYLNTAGGPFGATFRSSSGTSGEVVEVDVRAALGQQLGISVKSLTHTNRVGVLVKQTFPMQSLAVAGDPLATDACSALNLAVSALPLDGGVSPITGDWPPHPQVLGIPVSHWNPVRGLSDSLPGPVAVLPVQ